MLLGYRVRVGARVMVEFGLVLGLEKLELEIGFGIVRVLMIGSGLEFHGKVTGLGFVKCKGCFNVILVPSHSFDLVTFLV